MDPRAILSGQIDALLHELVMVEGALDAPALDPALRRAVRGPFAQGITKRRTNLEQLRRGGQGDFEAAWEALLREDELCRDLFREVVAVLGGALLRSADLDDGICRVADALLSELSHEADVGWRRFTLPAEDDFLAEATDVVRLRFPHSSVWTLPLAVHELGHHVAPDIEDRDDGSHPFRAMLDARREDGVEGAAFQKLHEMIADVFAVYALGPAYLYSCVLLRFNPLDAHARSETHPSDAERVHLLLGALERFGRSLGARGSYGGVLQQLREAWGSGLAAVGHDAGPGPEAEHALDASLDELCTGMETLLPDVGYDGYPDAVAMAGELERAADDEWLDVEGWRLTDVLNAAWHLRATRSNGVDPTALGQRALEICRRIVAARSASPATGDQR